MGRPLKFDPDAALSAIKAAFWERGYEGTSLQDIEAATGQNKQSLYRLIGGKRQMYLRALQDYDGREMQAAIDLMLTGSGGAGDRVGRLLRAVVADVRRTGDRRGCFLCNSAVDQAQLDEETMAEVTDTMRRFEAAFSEALTADAPYRRNARRREKTAVSLLAGYFGLRVLIKANTGVEALQDAADGIIAMI